MIDLFSLLHPFHPGIVPQRQELQDSPDVCPKSCGQIFAVTENTNINHMNPLKTDMSTGYDIGSLLNPMHPTLWLENEGTLPPQKTKANPTKQLNPNVGIGRVNRIYHNMILRSFNAKLRGLQAEEDQITHDKTKGKVLVGGGSGFVGTEVCSLLRRKGYDVITVSRTKFDSRVVTWDDIRFRGLPDNTIAVVNLAGQNMLDPLKRWNPAFKELVRESRIQTATSFKEAIVNRHKAGLDTPNVFVQITGVGIYPAGDNIIKYDEDSKIDPKSGGYMSRLVEDWEDAAKLPSDVPTRNVFLRSGVVLGRNGGMIKQIFLPFYLGGGGRMGSGEQNMPWIHVKDVSGIILHSIENDNVKGVLNGVAPQVISNQDFVNAFASSLYRPAFFPLPDFVWNLVFGEERAAIITKGVTVLPTRTEDSGYVFRYPNINQACQEFSHLFYQDPDITSTD